MKIFLLTLITVSSIAASAFATDLDDLSDQIDELNSKLDDANDKLDALLPDQVYVAPPKRSPSYVLVPVNTEPKSHPKPKDIPSRAILVHHMTEAEYQKRMAAHELTGADVNRHNRGE